MQAALRLCYCIYMCVMRVSSEFASNNAKYVIIESNHEKIGFMPKKEALLNFNTFNFLTQKRWTFSMDSVAIVHDLHPQTTNFLVLWDCRAQHLYLGQNCAKPGARWRDKC